ncbi:MAG: hypothetical protein IJU54_03150 [Alphaproteobacteria bacterium]|nr:hypothetical protein [Alphaproteobacteria bacterium]
MNNNLLLILMVINCVTYLNASDVYNTHDTNCLNIQNDNTLIIQENKEKTNNNMQNNCVNKLQEYYCWPPKDEISLNTAKKIMLSFKYCSDNHYNSHPTNEQVDFIEKLSQVAGNVIVNKEINTLNILEIIMQSNFNNDILYSESMHSNIYDWKYILSYCVTYDLKQVPMEFKKILYSIDKDYSKYLHYDVFLNKIELCYNNNDISCEQYKSLLQLLLYSSFTKQFIGLNNISLDKLNEYLNNNNILQHNTYNVNYIYDVIDKLVSINSDYKTIVIDCIAHAILHSINKQYYIKNIDPNNIKILHEIKEILYKNNYTKYISRRLT